MKKFYKFEVLLCTSGGLQGGDQILEVNGESLEGVTNDRYMIYFRILGPTLRADSGNMFTFLFQTLPYMSGT